MVDDIGSSSSSQKEEELDVADLENYLSQAMSQVTSPGMINLLS